MDARTFGLQMKALRGNRTQPEVERLSGVNQSQISKIENGTVSGPTFETIVRLCRVYGVEPNEVAAMMGLWPTPEIQDNEALIPEVNRVMTSIQNLLMDLAPDQQREFAAMLQGVVRIEQSELARQRESEDLDSLLPGFLRRKNRQ